MGEVKLPDEIEVELQNNALWLAEEKAGHGCVRIEAVRTLIADALDAERRWQADDFRATARAFNATRSLTFNTAADALDAAAESIEARIGRERVTPSAGETREE